MVVGDVQSGIGLSQDRVAQRQGQRELSTGEPLQEPLHAAAVELDDTPANAGTTTRAKADHSENQPKEGVGRGPEHDEEAIGQFEEAEHGSLTTYSANGLPELRGDIVWVPQNDLAEPVLGASAFDDGQRSSRNRRGSAHSSAAVDQDGDLVPQQGHQRLNRNGEDAIALLLAVQDREVAVGHGARQNGRRLFHGEADYRDNSSLQ
jgi:hypothetical protein